MTLGYEKRINNTIAEIDVVTSEAEANITVINARAASSARMIVAQATADAFEVVEEAKAQAYGGVQDSLDLSPEEVVQYLKLKSIAGHSPNRVVYGIPGPIEP